jgi:hypothetical protein
MTAAAGIGEEGRRKKKRARAMKTKRTKVRKTRMMKTKVCLVANDKK